MIDFEDIKKYLPQYLSNIANENLFSELKNFPENIDKRLYTSFLKNDFIIYQGDGFSELLPIELPNTTTKKLNGMVLSNTCDIDQDNVRLMSSRLIHTPIINLQKYHEMLINMFVVTNKKSKEIIEQHISSIRKQYISHVFFLPKGGDLVNDSIILFDRVTTLPSNYLSKSEIKAQRLFTLSDFGFYLFLFKLSIHFTRVRENVSRNSV